MFNEHLLPRSWDAKICRTEYGCQNLSWRYSIGEECSTASSRDEKHCMVKYSMILVSSSSNKLDMGKRYGFSADRNFSIVRS